VKVISGAIGGYANIGYTLVLRPWFWLLAHRADCRIFLDENVKDIIQKVFTDAGFSSGTDFKFRTTGNYDKIKYCVQYRETDFAFVSRLMEQYGIYYYFEHQDGQHTMVLADSRASHSAVPDLPQVKYHIQTEAYRRVEQQIDSWVSDRRFCTGKIEFNDYDYLKPPKQLRAPKEASEKYKRSRFEVYDYPGKYDEQDKGKHFAQFRLEAEQAMDRRRYAGGDAPSLFAGGLVTLEKHPTSAENREYLLVRVSHSFGTQVYGSTQSQSGAAYHGHCEFLASDRPFRSLPLTPKPRIYGIQTAKVVGKKGEDVHRGEAQQRIQADAFGGRGMRGRKRRRIKDHQRNEEAAEAEQDRRCVCRHVAHSLAHEKQRQARPQRQQPCPQQQRTFLSAPPGSKLIGQLHRLVAVLGYIG